MYKIKQLLRKEIENVEKYNIVYSYKRNKTYIKILDELQAYTVRKQKINRVSFRVFLCALSSCVCNYIFNTSPWKTKQKIYEREYIRKRARLYNTSDKKQTNNMGFHIYRYIQPSLVSLKRCLSFICVCIGHMHFSLLFYLFFAVFNDITRLAGPVNVAAAPLRTSPRNVCVCVCYIYTVSETDISSCGFDDRLSNNPKVFRRDDKRIRKCFCWPNSRKREFRCFFGINQKMISKKEKIRFG